VNPNREVRSTLEEVRMVDGEGGRPMIRGYAAVFNSRSQVMTTPGGKPFVETIAPGAFRRSLLEADVAGLFNHDASKLLGRRSVGTLRLAEDERGLVYEIDPPDTSYARDLVASLSRRDISGSSFSFATVEDDWSKDADGLAVRELRQAHVFDVGPVTFPAYLEASAAYRSYDLAHPPGGAPEIIAPTPGQVRALQRLRLASLT
jgi:HK97 family phage prohead protease